MDWAHVLIAAIGALTGGSLGSWAMKVYQERHRQQRQVRADVWDHQTAIIERQDAQIAALQDGESACRERLASVRSDNRWLYSLLQQHHGMLTRAGIATDPLPPMPEHREEDAAEFRARQTEHTTGLLRQEAQDLLKRDAMGGGPIDSPY